MVQIRACLQSAMQDCDLSDQTFSVWSSLLAAVDPGDLGSLIDQTFALVAQNWPSFGEETHSNVYETIGELIKTHNGLMKDRIDSLPSLAGIAMLSKYEAELCRLKAKVELAPHFDTFAGRCDEENAVVVTQALKELIAFLECNQKFLHDSAVSQKPSPVLTRLSRALLDASARFSENHFEITVSCARCLGLIGCLDPYRVEAVRQKRQIVVYHNFERASEVIDFTAFLLETVLVKVFHSTTNARAQSFLAYVMQELLRFCGFNQIASQRPRASSPTLASQRWNEIPESVRGTLTPFLSSRYMIRTSASTTTSTLQEYPIFVGDISHADWLRAFAYDMLQRGKGENVRKIFPVLARVIRGHDLSIANFMLPFAVLNVIVGGDDQEAANVGEELTRVLKADIPANDHARASAIKQCSEVRRRPRRLDAVALTRARMSFKYSTISPIGFKRNEKADRSTEPCSRKPHLPGPTLKRRKKSSKLAPWNESFKTRQPKPFRDGRWSVDRTRERFFIGRHSYDKTEGEQS